MLAPWCELESAEEIAEPGPVLAGRFRAGLLFAKEAHPCPRCALSAPGWRPPAKERTVAMDHCPAMD